MEAKMFQCGCARGVLVACVISFTVACSEQSTRQMGNGFGLEFESTPLFLWAFDDCKLVDGLVATEGNAGPSLPGYTAEVVEDESGGCHAQLAFVRTEGASSGVTGYLDAFGKEGFAIVSGFSVDKCPDKTDCRLVIEAYSNSGDEFETDRLWRYSLEIVTRGNKIHVNAYGYRESPFGGTDVPRVSVNASGSYTPNERHHATLLVDATHRRLIVYVDGIVRGESKFDFKTKPLNAFAIDGEALYVADGTLGEDPIATVQGVPLDNMVRIDDFGIYDLTNAELAAVAGQ